MKARKSKLRNFAIKYAKVLDLKDLPKDDFRAAEYVMREVVGLAAAIGKFDAGLQRDADNCFREWKAFQS